MDNGQQHYLDGLETHVRANDALTAEQTLWLIGLARGGFWGRMAAGASQDAKAHRFALRAIVKALLDRSSERWGGAHWRPILALLAPRPTDCDQLGAVPEGVRLDVGLRFVEAGELHE